MTIAQTVTTTFYNRPIKNDFFSTVLNKFSLAWILFGWGRGVLEGRKDRRYAGKDGERVVGFVDFTFLIHRATWYRKVARWGFPCFVLNIRI